MLPISTVTEMTISETAPHVLSINGVQIGCDYCEHHSDPSIRIYTLRNVLLRQSYSQFTGNMTLRVRVGIVTDMQSIDVVALPGSKPYDAGERYLTFVGFLQLRED